MAEISDPSAIVPAARGRRTRPAVIEAAASEAALPVATPADPPHAILAPASPGAPNDEGDATMATAAETHADPVNTTTDAAHAAFGDMKDRATSAFATSQRFGAEFVDFQKGNVEAMVASARAAAKAGETLAQAAAEFGRRSFEHATGAIKGLTAARTPTEFFQLQSDFARSAFDHAVAEASRGSERMVRVMSDVFQPLSSRYAVAAEKLKTPAL